MRATTQVTLESGIRFDPKKYTRAEVDPRHRGGQASVKITSVYLRGSGIYVELELDIALDVVMSEAGIRVGLYEPEEEVAS